MAIEDRFGQLAWQAIKKLGRGANDVPKAPQLASTAGALSVDRMHLSDAQLLPGDLRQVKNLLRAGDTERAQGLVSELLASGRLLEERQVAPAPPRMSDVLQLVRHARGLGLNSQVKDGLNWAVKLLRENPERHDLAASEAQQAQSLMGGRSASKGHPGYHQPAAYPAASKGADAIASLALATGNEAIAREALAPSADHAAIRGYHEAPEGFETIAG